MTMLEPLVNLLVLLTILSIVAERVTNAWKLNHPMLRQQKKHDPKWERDREQGIFTRALLVGVVVAVLIKANMFEIVTNLNEPWETIGWVRTGQGTWFQSSALSGWGEFLYAVGGSVLTGLALSFGSKFWHDTLGSVYELRSFVRERRPSASTAKKPKGGSANA